jgi:hypothetical protein
MRLTRYLRNEDGQLYACFVGLQRTNGQYSIGWSKYNNKKEKGGFSRKRGKQIALGRAVKCSDIYFTNSSFFKTLEPELEKFISFCQQVFDTSSLPVNYMIL